MRSIMLTVMAFICPAVVSAQELPQGTHWVGTRTCDGAQAALVWGYPDRVGENGFFVLNSVGPEGRGRSSQWQTKAYSVSNGKDGMIALDFLSQIRPERVENATRRTRLEPDRLELRLEANAERLIGGNEKCRYDLGLDQSAHMGVDDLPSREWSAWLMFRNNQFRNATLHMATEGGRALLVLIQSNSFGASGLTCVYRMEKAGGFEFRRVVFPGLDGCTPGPSAFGMVENAPAIALRYDDPGREQIIFVRNATDGTVAARLSEIPVLLERRRQAEEERIAAERAALERAEAERRARLAAREDAINGLIASYNARSSFAGLGWTISELPVDRPMPEIATQGGPNSIVTSQLWSFPDREVEREEIAAISAGLVWASDQGPTLSLIGAHWHSGQYLIRGRQMLRYPAGFPQPRLNEVLAKIQQDYGTAVIDETVPSGYGFGGETSQYRRLAYPVIDGVVAQTECWEAGALDVQWSEDGCDGILVITIRTEPTSPDFVAAVTYTFHDFRLQTENTKNETGARRALRNIPMLD